MAHSSVHLIEPIWQVTWATVAGFQIHNSNAKLAFHTVILQTVERTFQALRKGHDIFKPML